MTSPAAIAEVFSISVRSAYVKLPAPQSGEVASHLSPFHTMPERDAARNYSALCRVGYREIRAKRSQHSLSEDEL
jgi:hypothetical protein